MDSSDESRKENSEELPRDSDESPSQKSRPSFPHISPSTSSDSDQGTAEVDEDQNASAEVDESHVVRNKKRPYQELQKEYWEDPEKRQNKKAETDFQNDPLIEYGYEHGQTEDDDVGQNEDDEVGQNDNEYFEDDDEVGQNEDDEVGQTDNEYFEDDDEVGDSEDDEVGQNDNEYFEDDDEVGQTDNEYFEDDDEVGHSEDDEVGQTDNEYFDDDDEVGENDNESSEDDEQLFHGEERNSYKRFCREKILCERSDIDNPRSAIENPSSPFTEESDEVTEKFQSFLSELPGEENDVAYLLLRHEVDEITIALSKEEIRELQVLQPFWASAQYIDSYLYCRLRLFPDDIQQRVHQCSAYMITLNIHDLDEWRDAAPLHILEEALDLEMKEVDFNIIPLVYRKHWTLAIVCGLGPRRDENLPGVPWRTPCILHFNSLQGSGITKCHGYAIAKAVARKARIEANHVVWHEIWSPQQPNLMDCGFYVMRFAVEFLKNIKSSNPLPVHDLFYALHYNCLEEDFAPKAGWQLRGFLGSLNRDERDWTTVFSEGKQCTIDYLPYCKPMRIIALRGNEYQVEISNKLRPECVSLDYLKEHWKHIYDDYIEMIGGEKD